MASVVVSFFMPRPVVGISPMTCSPDFTSIQPHHDQDASFPTLNTAACLLLSFVSGSSTYVQIDCPACRQEPRLQLVGFPPSVNPVQAPRANVTPASVRSHDEFNSLLLLSASSRTPLLTFWTASWCPSCRVVKPIVREAVEGGTGEGQGGVGFAEIEFDAPGMSDFGMRYFVRGNPQGKGGRTHAHVRLTMAVGQLSAIAA